MDGDVIVSIPVSREAAALLQNEERVRAAGRLLSDMLVPAKAAADPMAALIAEIKADARATGVTDDEIDAELAAYNSERRLRR